MWKVTANKGEFKSDPSMETTVGAIGDYQFTKVYLLRMHGCVIEPVQATPEPGLALPRAEWQACNNEVLHEPWHPDIKCTEIGKCGLDCIKTKWTLSVWVKDCGIFWRPALVINLDQVNDPGRSYRWCYSKVCRQRNFRK